MADAGFNYLHPDMDLVERELIDIITKLENEEIDIDEAIRRTDLIFPRLANLIEGQMNYRGEERDLYRERLDEIRDIYQELNELIEEIRETESNRPKGGEPPKSRGGSRASQIMRAVLAKAKAGTLKHKKGDKAGEDWWEDDKPRKVSKYVVDRMMDKSNKKEF
jgi:hypothetical protein